MSFRKNFIEYSEKKHPIYKVLFNFRGEYRIRTGDLLPARQAL